MALVSLTYLKLHSLRQFPAFLRYSRPAQKAAEAADGNLGVKVTGFWYLRFYTMTLWVRHEDMVVYVRSDAHINAMKTMPGLGIGKAYHYEAHELPSWCEAVHLLELYGREV